MIVMFVDLAGFTALTEAHGDAAATRVLDDFCGIVRDVAERVGLREIKTIGDAFLLTGEDPSAAVTGAREIVGRIGRLEGYPDVRIGIHDGEVLERDGDVFGRAVNLAARVAGEASAGQILVTQDVADSVQDIEPASLGARRLRNIPQPVELFDVGEEGAHRERDPVCHMMLSPGSAVSTYRLEGKQYYFCSKDCLMVFIEDPRAYLDTG